MSHYHRILAAFVAEPVAILPEKYEAIRAFLLAKGRGEDVGPDQVAAIAGQRRADGVLVSGRGVAVLPVQGVIAQRVGMLEAASGGVSTEKLGATLDGLLADEQVRAIVLAFDSPGGGVFGVDELAGKIRAAREQKKVVSIADSMAASAAYWLASQASEVYVTPGGQVGSIGVFAAHEDVSRQQEMEGVKTTYVRAGRYKAEAAPELPLSDEALAEMQAKVDAYYAAFVTAVAKGRGVGRAKVEADFGQGRMVLAEGAVARGMADRVGTLEDLVARLGGPPPGAARARARAAARAHAAGLED